MAVERRQSLGTRGTTLSPGDTNELKQVTPPTLSLAFLTWPRGMGEHRLLPTEGVVVRAKQDNGHGCACEQDGERPRTKPGTRIAGGGEA